MAAIKLLTVFSAKNNQNFINMNKYSIFKRSSNQVNTLYMLQSKDYRTRGDSLNKIKPLLFLKGTSNLNNSFNSTVAVTDKRHISEQKDKLQGKILEKKEQINIDDIKGKIVSIFFKSIAYIIYAGEIILASNELKLIKQFIIKTYFWIYNLFRVHVLHNPNVKDALNVVKGKVAASKKDETNK